MKQYLSLHIKALYITDISIIDHHKSFIENQGKLMIQNIIFNDLEMCNIANLQLKQL